ALLYQRCKGPADERTNLGSDRSAIFRSGQGRMFHTFTCAIVGHAVVAQVSKPAVSPTSSRQGILNDEHGCGLEIRDTAGWKPALRLHHGFVCEMFRLGHPTQSP